MEEKTKVKRFYEKEPSPFVPVGEWQEDEAGLPKYVITGKKNLDDEIQLYKDSYDLKLIIDQLTKGNTDVLVNLQAKEAGAVYGDVNKFPEEYHPVAQAQYLHTLYENQPDSVKAKFPTYEIFAAYFNNLTDAALAALKEEPKKEEVVNDKQE